MKPLGDGFIKLIKMIIAPIIFCTVVAGIAGMEDMKKVGRTGGQALLYFEVVSTIALIVGLVVVNMRAARRGHEHRREHARHQSARRLHRRPASCAQHVDFLLNIIPNTVVDAFAKGEILQVLLFSVLFGFALHRLGERGTLLFELDRKPRHVLFGIVGIIMKLAPIGAFGAMAFTIGNYGVGSLLSLGKLMATFYLTCLLFIFVRARHRSRACTASRILKFIALHPGRAADRAGHIVVRVGAAAHDRQAGAARLRASRWSAWSIPTGYSFNLDGTSIYLTMAAVFVAQATNTPMTLDAADHAARGAAADLEGRRRRHRQRLHRPGGDAVRGRPRAGRRPGTDPRHRPLHVRGARADQPGRQRRRDHRGAAAGRENSISSG